jgi:hypothetical protein
MSPDTPGRKHPGHQKATGRRLPIGPHLTGQLGSAVMNETTAVLLAELRAAIADLEAGTGSAEHVADLAGRVERRLEAEAELHDDDDTLLEDLQEGAVKFEADHPRLADALRRIVDGLSGLGI